jgi:hypothetical protein
MKKINYKRFRSISPKSHFIEKKFHPAHSKKKKNFSFSVFSMKKNYNDCSFFNKNLKFNETSLKFNLLVKFDLRNN